MRISNATEASQAALRSPPSDPATRAEIAQRTRQPRANSSQAGEAQKNFKAGEAQKNFKTAWGNLPPFVSTSTYCAPSAQRVIDELNEYDKHMGDPALKSKLVADINAQRDRISPETLNRLANAKDMSSIRDELRRVQDEVNRLTEGFVPPTRLAADCLNLQNVILIARAEQLEREGQPRNDELHKMLIGGIPKMKQLFEQAKSPYERSGTRI